MIRVFSNFAVDTSRRAGFIRGIAVAMLLQGMPVTAAIFLKR
jgi:hypothetical protein